MAMKIAVVEKTKVGYADPYAGFFNFPYDRFQLTNSNKSKVLKRDITLDEDFKDYDYVVLVGKEPCKHIAKIGNVTKYAGHIVQDKYIPMLNPVAVKFNPGIKDALDAALSKLHAHISGTYKETLGKYEGITCARRAKEWLTKLLRAHTITRVATDIETSSLFSRDGYVLGIAMSYEEGSGVYIESDCIDDEVEYLLQKIFDEKEIIFHNAKFDMSWLAYHFNFNFTKWQDLMLCHYLLNENEPHDLKYLILKYTNMGDYDKELENFKRAYCKSHGIKLADFSYEYIPFDIMVPYAGGDVDGTLRLFNKFYPIIEKHFSGLYNRIMLRGTQFLLEIENTGVPFSKSHLEEANNIFTEEIFNLSEKLYEYEEVKELEKETGDKFNPNSPAQLSKLFFEKLGLTPIKKTDTGAYSTDKEVLEKLSKLHPIPDIVAQIRGKVKLRSTYITKVLKGMDSDGRLRAGFHLHTVTSGRLSSSGKLNMQQLPRDDKTVKNCIRHLDPDWIIFSQDLKTAEMYYAAVLSGDRNLAKVFKDGGDFHSSIAKMTFNLTCPVEEIAEKFPKFRQASKAISFGILYGAGPAKVAQSAGISYKEAENIIKQYFKTFKRLGDWIKDTQDEIKENGCIYSVFGRKRRVPNVFSSDDYEQGHAVRSAMNFTVQSVASDVNLMIAMDSHDDLKESNIRGEIFALVHDSIIGACHKDDVKKVEQLLLANTIKDRGVSISGCPIGVDFGYGESYAKAG